MRIVETILYILAVASLIYGFFVLALGAGNNFYLIWFLLALVLALFAVSLHAGVWACVPVWAKRTLAAVVTVGVLALVIVEGCVISRMNEKGEANCDYIIVLGAQVKEDGPSPVLLYRLDKAIAYLNENPDTLCIVSGGQGPKEPFAEAVGMADYLEGQGIARERILMEDASKTTAENIANSKKLMREGASVGIITNDFHMFRALQIAHKQGLSNACGIAAGSTRGYLVNNMLREFFAEIKFLIS